MKFLFVYEFKGENEQGTGSIEMSIGGTDKITSEVIEKARIYVTELFEKDGKKIDTLVPTGWFKFDE